MNGILTMQGFNFQTDTDAPITAEVIPQERAAVIKEFDSDTKTIKLLSGGTGDVYIKFTAPETEDFLALEETVPYSLESENDKRNIQNGMYLGQGTNTAIKASMSSDVTTTIPLYGFSGYDVSKITVTPLNTYSSVTVSNIQKAGTGSDNNGIKCDVTVKKGFTNTVTDISFRIQASEKLLMYSPNEYTPKFDVIKVVAVTPI